jgi:hypothetical protein
MYCPQCGATNEESAAFCASCGTDLKKYTEQWNPDSTDTQASAADGAAQATEAFPAGAPGAQETPAATPVGTPPPYQPQYRQAPQTPPPYQQAPPYQQQPGYQQGGQYPPAGYQQQPYRAGSPGGVVPHVPSYLGWAITVLILCFWPTGIAAVVYATKVGNLLAIGDVFAAQEASRKAKMWCWITFGIAVAGWVISIIFIILAFAVWGGIVINSGTF